MSAASGRFADVECSVPVALFVTCGNVSCSRNQFDQNTTQRQVLCAIFAVPHSFFLVVQSLLLLLGSVYSVYRSLQCYLFLVGLWCTALFLGGCPSLTYAWVCVGDDSAGCVAGHCSCSGQTLTLATFKISGQTVVFVQTPALSRCRLGSVVQQQQGLHAGLLHCWGGCHAHRTLHG